MRGCRVGARPRGRLAGVFAVVMLAVAAPATIARPAAAEPTGCVVDPAEMLGWWKGEHDLLAEVGPDLGGSADFPDAAVGAGFGLGLGDGVSVSTLPAVSDGVSLEAWIKPTPSLFSQALFSRWTFVGGASDDAFAVVLTTDGLIFYVDERSSREPDTLAARTPVLFDGGFHHVAATWGSGEMALYIDGVAVATRTVRGGTINAAESTPFHIGTSSDPGYLPYDGVVDEPAVYRRALTSTEVAAIHAAGSNGKCMPTPPNTQVSKLADNPGSANDWYGRAIDVDGATAVIGVSESDPGGSVRMLTRSGTTWSPQDSVAGADTAANDAFGFAVAVDGDTAVVGAFEDDAGQFLNRGSAYVFVRDGSGNWSQQAKIEPSTSSSVQNFGRSVDISGDTLVVGSFNDDNPGAIDSGAVYVFTRSGTTWTQEARLTASDRATGDGFGYDVAIDGEALVAGADLGDDDGRGAIDSGAAYVFTRSGTTWSETAKLTSSDSGANDAFGFAVALDGTTTVIGANGAGATTAGAAYVFVGSGATWTQEAILVAPDGAFDDRFGFDVALDGDLAVVGARFDDDSIAGVDAGSAHVFLRAGTAWSHVAKLAADDAAAGDEFGNAVSLHAGFALVGAYRDDEAGLVDRGSVYVYGT